MSRWIAALIVALAPASAPADSQISLQEALLRAKPAVALVVSEVVVRVTLRCGATQSEVAAPPFRETGTAWAVSPSGWLITNGHVVSAAHRPPASLLKQQAEKVARPGCRIVKTSAEPSISVMLSNGFRLPATIIKYSPPVVGEEMSGQDLALLKLEAADLPSLELGDSTAARIGDRLHILGFPGVVLGHELLNASAKVEASVTNGAISGFRQDRANQPVIQTDAPAAWGNSGGPAVDDQGRVVGVLTFVTLAPEEGGSIVQGFNFVIPARAVHEFLKDTDVNPGEPSKFNAAWARALRDFFAGDYRRAEESFEEANRLMPELPDIKRLRADNLERIKNPPPRPFPWALLATGVVVASLVAGGGLWVAQRKRNRHRIRPSELARLIDSADPPVILDARDGATYQRSPVRIPKALHLTADELQKGVTSLKVEPERLVVAYCT